jgi:hypothetical protein
MDAGFKIGIKLELLLEPKQRRSEDFAYLDDFGQFAAHCNAARCSAPRMMQEEE